jgi:dCMP deaminase
MLSRKWDLRFLQLAAELAKWSKDPSTKVGCVIFDNDKTQLSSGFNGFARGVKDDEARYNHRDTKYKMIVHAEANAIATAARKGHRLLGANLYTTNFPCSQCCALIIQAGIERVICYDPTEDYKSRWLEDIKLSTCMMSEAGVVYKTYPWPE